MQRFLSIILLIFCLLPSGVFASHYDMILAGDPVLEDIRFLSLETGRPILSFTIPLSPHEVRRFLYSIDESLLSAPALEAFYRVNRRLIPQAPRVNFSSDEFSVFFGINSTIEARARTNQSISWYPRHPTIPAVVSFPTRFFISDFLQLYLEPKWQMSPTHYQRVGSFGLNAPLDYTLYDHLMPHRAFLAAGGPMWSFQIGRDRLSWGTGHMGNLSVSDNPDFYDFARFSFFTRIFKYSSLVVQMPLDIRDGFLCPSVFPGSAVPDGNLYRTMNRYFYLHRLDFMLFDRLTIGISEGVMVGNAPMELRFLNPMMVFRQLIAWTQYDRWGGENQLGKAGYMVGSFFSAEVNWNIKNSLSVYGQFVMNEFEMPDELERLSYPSPNGLGFLLGIQYSHSFSNWASVFFFEFVHTSPFLYMSPSPFASFIHMRFLLDDTPQYAFIGFPRDQMMFTLGARFFRGNDLSVSGVFSLLFNGARDLRYDWEPGWHTHGERTPSGITERQFIGTVSARWTPQPFLTLSGSLTGIHSHNNRHISGAQEAGLQTAFSVGVSF